MHILNDDRNSRSFIAPGKLILIGEYAVLENAPALVAGIQAYARASITKNEMPYSVIRSVNLPDGELRFQLGHNKIHWIDNNSENIYPFIRSLLLQLCKEELRNDLFFDLHLDTREFYSDDGAKYGLGSSAAVTVVAAIAIIAFLQGDWDKRRIFSIAMRAHQHAQGEAGSGIDLAASAFGGVFCYQRTKTTGSPKRLKFPDGLDWVPVWTGKSASTSDLVSKFNRFKDENKNDYQRIITKMKSISEMSCREFASGDSPSFIKGINDYYSLMQEFTDVSGIPVISRDHQKIAEIARRTGASYKPSGAGFGDFGIAFVTSETIKINFTEAIKNSPYKVMVFKVDNHGAISISD